MYGNTDDRDQGFNTAFVVLMCLCLGASCILWGVVLGQSRVFDNCREFGKMHIKQGEALVCRVIKLKKVEEYVDQ